MTDSFAAIGEASCTSPAPSERAGSRADRFRANQIPRRIRERERFQGRRQLAEKVEAADHIEAGRLGRLHLRAEFLGSGCPDLLRSAVGPLSTVASINTTGGAEIPSTKTNKTKMRAAASTSRGDSVNQVTLIGRLVATPEMLETASGNRVTTVRVATNGKDRAEFHDVVLWGLLADFACQHLGKGRLVYIEGRLESRQWQAPDGSTRRTVEIVANRLQALSAKSTPAA